MKNPFSLYVGSLKSALQGDITGAQALYEQAEALKLEQGLSFSESVHPDLPYLEQALTTLLSSYDFARCMRPNGTFYGTRGKCKSGTEAAPADRRGTGKKGGDEAAAAARAEGKRGKQLVKARAAGKKAALEASRKAGGEKQSRNNARLRAMKELMADPKRQAKLRKLIASGGDAPALEKFWGDLAIEAEGRIARKSK